MSALFFNRAPFIAISHGGQETQEENHYCVPSAVSSTRLRNGIAANHQVPRKSGMYRYGYGIEIQNQFDVILVPVLKLPKFDKIASTVAYVPGTLRYLVDP